MKLFEKINDEASEVDVPKNPVDDEMIIEIKKLIETYIPPFMERYYEKLKELTKDKTIVRNSYDLNQETIKELGIEQIEEPLTKFIMHSVGPKIESVLSSQETTREKAKELAEESIAKLVDEGLGRIDAQVEMLIAEVLVEEKVDAKEELEEEEFIAEVISEYVEIEDDFPEEPVEEISEEVIEEPEEIIEEPVDEIVEYPEIIEGIVDLPMEETVKPKVIEFDKVRAQLIENILKKHAHRIEAKFPEEQEQIRAKELFKQRIESIVDDIISETRKNESKNT